MQVVAKTRQTAVSFNPTRETQAGLEILAKLIKTFKAMRSGLKPKSDHSRIVRDEETQTVVLAAVKVP